MGAADGLEAVGRGVVSGGVDEDDVGREGDGALRAEGGLVGDVGIGVVGAGDLEEFIDEGSASGDHHLGRADGHRKGEKDLGPRESGDVAAKSDAVRTVPIKQAKRANGFFIRRRFLPYAKPP